MAATTSSNNIKPKTERFIADLQRDFPSLKFEPGRHDAWSAQSQTITYDPKQSFKQLSWSVLHELAHAELDHRHYTSDFELVKLEALAWQRAQQIGQKYAIVIDEEHIQDCLDTYRAWLHKRSACPTCQTRSPQLNETTYRCLNCQTEWTVTPRLARPYRLTTK